MREWLIAADDRTGALEMAAEMAVVLGAPVEVVGATPATTSCVVDLGSRSSDQPTAVARAAAVDEVPSAWTAHKIDSTLRGHWAAEVAARQRVLGRPLVLVPAWPAMGRTCRDGVVYVDGRPVASVPACLPAARSARPEELGGLSAGECVWLDVGSDVELAAVAAGVAEAEVLVAGPAGAIGAVARQRGGTAVAPMPPPRLPRPWLVVCGSATAVSANQVDALIAARPDVRVVRTPPAGPTLDPAVAFDLGLRARPLLGEFGTVVVIGGDTAAAVLGDSPRSVGGYAAPGMPWSRAKDGPGPVVVTKAGGFGAADALVRLLS